MNKSYKLSFLFFVILSYFTFYSFYGNRGYFSYTKAIKKSHNLYNELNVLRAKKIELYNNVLLLGDNILDPDILDEYSRRTIGYVKRDDMFCNKK